MGQHVEVSMHEASLAFMWVDSMMQHSIIQEPMAQASTQPSITGCIQLQTGRL